TMSGLVFGWGATSARIVPVATTRRVPPSTFTSVTALSDPSSTWVLSGNARTSLLPDPPVSRPWPAANSAPATAGDLPSLPTTNAAPATLSMRAIPTTTERGGRAGSGAGLGSEGVVGGAGFGSSRGTGAGSGGRTGSGRRGSSRGGGEGG